MEWYGWTGLAVYVNLCRVFFLSTSLNSIQVMSAFFVCLSFIFLNQSIYIFYYRCCYCKIIDCSMFYLFSYLTHYFCLFSLIFKIAHQKLLQFILLSIYHIWKGRNVYRYSILHLHVEAISFLSISFYAWAVTMTITTTITTKKKQWQDNTNCRVEERKRNRKENVFHSIHSIFATGKYKS